LAKTAVMGGSLQDNLVSSALGSVVAIGGAVAANKIGDITVFDQGKVTKVVMHAALGGLMAEAMGGDFRTGAIAAGANEALVDFLADKILPKGVDPSSPEYLKGVGNLLAASQLVGVLTAAITGGDASIASDVTSNATQYNYLNHAQMQELAEELQACKATNSCEGVASKYFEKHLANEKVLREVCAVDTKSCQKAALDIYNTVLGYQRGDYDTDLPSDLKQAFAAFHQLNIDASVVPTAEIARPSAEAFVQSLGLDISDPKVQAIVGTMATFIAGKAAASRAPKTGMKMPAELPDNLTGYANPNDIRFTQDSVSGVFRNGTVLDSTIDALRKGIISPSEIPPIRVFEKDGLIYSLDNRRLLAASAAGVPVKIVPATAAEIRKEVKKKMTTLNKGVIICVRDICK